MNIKANWKEPIPLESGKSRKLIYWANTNNISDTPGCYLFYNQHGSSISIIYIGKATNLRKRIEDQFTKNVSLMVALKDYGNGSKMLMYCELEGQNLKKIAILEKHLIKSATLDGHNLLNIHGTRQIFKHTIEFTRMTRASQTIYKRRMNILS